MANDIGAKAIICLADLSALANVAKYRPLLPIFYVTVEEHMARICRMHYGAIGVLVDPAARNQTEIL